MTKNDLPTTPTQVYVEGDRVVARRGSSEPLTSKRASGWHPVGAPIGQDGFSYIVHQSFTHPFVPYISRTTGEPNGGCDTCGWSEDIHTPPVTHVECDRCHAEVDVWAVVEVKCDDDWGPHTYFADTDRPLTMSTRLRQDRFFCTNSCVDAWFEEKK